MEGLLLELAEVAERYANASSKESDEQSFNLLDVSDFEMPCRFIPEEDEFRNRMGTLTREQQAALLATFWLGRDYSQPDEYPPLLERARRSLDNLPSYLLSSFALAPALRKGVAILRG